MGQNIGVKENKASILFSPYFWGCLMQLYEMEWVPVKHVLMVEKKGYEMVKLKNLPSRMRDNWGPQL